MSTPVLYIAITNHGFGHAVRAACVASLVKKLCPEILLVLVTSAPRFLLESYIESDFIYRPQTLDVGVIQSDSLTMDLSTTKAKLEEIRRRQNSLIAGEVNFIKLNKIGLILADIPPLAALIGKAAGIPVWMMGNFGWDFIYRPWGEDWKDIAAWISDCHQQCDRLFRLPLHEPMNSFPQTTDVGLTGGTPKYNTKELREKFSLTQPSQRTVLLSFGGIGLAALPYHNLKYFPDWQFITFDHQAPTLDNLIAIKDRQYRPVDFMPLCGRLISKPGYSTFAEALRLGAPIVTLTRSGFAESAILLEGIQNYGQHQIISPEEFYQGKWEFLHQQPQKPLLSTTLATDGAEAIATAVVEYLTKTG